MHRFSRTLLVAEQASGRQRAACGRPRARLLPPARLLTCAAPLSPSLLSCLCSKMVTASETHKNLIRGCLPYAKIQ